jgi:hypothetical protein
MALSPSELEHAEITSNFSTTSTTLVDVTGLTVTVDVGTRPVIIWFSCGYANTTAAVSGYEISILEDGVGIGNAKAVGNAIAEGYAVTRMIRRAPAAGSHTYKIQARTVAAGTLSIAADTGASYGPASISVWEV